MNHSFPTQNQTGLLTAFNLFSLFTTLQTTFAQCVRLFLIFEQLKIEQNQMNDIAVPCVVRITSEVSGSDGSSSMATVCGATACLQDAGVPITAPVAGVSIGLMTPSKGKYYKATQ